LPTIVGERYQVSRESARALARIARRLGQRRNFRSRLVWRVHGSGRLA
jgi:hypothetical protein